MELEWIYLLKDNSNVPQDGKDVLLAIVDEEFPVQGYWDGESWCVSLDVLSQINVSYQSPQMPDDSLVYAYCLLPSLPPKRDDLSLYDESGFYEKYIDPKKSDDDSERYEESKFYDK